MAKALLHRRGMAATVLAASTAAEQLVELTKLRQHYAAEVAAVNNLERELRASHAATQAETTALSISARLRRFHRCKKIGGLMLRAKNAPRLSRPNRSFLPRQGRD